MINKIAGFQPKLVEVVHASSNLAGTANEAIVKMAPYSVLDKFLNTTFSVVSKKEPQITKGLELDPVLSYKASHGLLDIIA